jgi:hypothetical protein
MMLPPLCAHRARYAGVSATFLKLTSVGAGVGNAEPASVGAREEMTDSAFETNVTGGGLHRSNIGSSDALRSCLVCIGAMIVHVVIELCASNISTGLWFLFSPSGVVVDQMYALRSSLPQMMCPLLSAKAPRI